MSTRMTRYLALFAGLALIVAGLTVPVWMASPGIGDIQAAQILYDSQAFHWLYVITVIVSCVLIAPVIVLLAVRLYPLRPELSLVGASAFLLGLILEAAGSASSLARFGGAVTGAMEADPLWISIYHSLTSLYLAVDFAGVALIYVAGVLLALALWRHHLISSILLLLAAVVFVVALFLPSFYSTFTLAGSIVIFGLAYGALGYATADLDSREEALQETETEAAGLRSSTTSRSRRSRRSSRRRR
ncbi:MAG: hypothetical protein HPY83_13745 [Anaerolineae bacterium]|nr:hypothetical protein [Anaerolineae bacterium]